MAAPGASGARGDHGSPATTPAVAGPGESAPAETAPQAPLQVGGPVLWVLVFLSGVYGGYFGAAQGVLLLGLMGVAFTDSMQRINAVKNVLAGLVNGIAAVVFIFVTHIDWGAAGLIAAGAILGGQLGARIGKKLPPWGLRRADHLRRRRGTGEAARLTGQQILHSPAKDGLAPPAGAAARPP